MRNGTSKRHILVVDDEPQVRATICDALILEGYDVTTAANGSEALKALETFEPDAIVFDLWMPVVDGFEFRRAQAKSHPDIPVVVLSALDLRDPKLAALNANALVPKPFDLDTLYTAVADVLKPANGTDERRAATPRV